MKTTKNIKVLALIFITSVLLIAAASSNIAYVKAATQDSVYVYSSLGGTITSDGTTLPGGASYPFENGTAIDLVPVSSTGYQFLCWEVVSASESYTSDNCTLTYTPTAANSAVQALFTPTSNATTTSTSTGTSSIQILLSAGGSTNPAPATYTNYTIGTVNNFQATPGTGFKFLYWIVSPSTGANIYTTNTLSLNVTASTCGLQAMFVPTDSTVSVPVVDEYSSAAIIALTVALIAVAIGTIAVTKKAKN